VPSLCACDEPEANQSHYPDDMHVHPGCIVFHAGRTCALPEKKVPDGQRRLPL
jgi:hypothetical protein